MTKPAKDGEKAMRSLLVPSAKEIALTSIHSFSQSFVHVKSLASSRLAWRSPVESSKVILLHTNADTIAGHLFLCLRLGGFRSIVQKQPRNQSFETITLATWMKTDFY